MSKSLAVNASAGRGRNQTLMLPIRHTCFKNILTWQKSEQVINSFTLSDISNCTKPAEILRKNA